MQQQHISRASSEDGTDSRPPWEAQATELQQLKADLLAAQTRLRDAGGFMVLWGKIRGGGLWHVALFCSLLVIIWLGCQCYLVLRTAEIKSSIVAMPVPCQIQDVIACTVTFCVEQVLHMCCRL